MIDRDGRPKILDFGLAKLGARRRPRPMSRRCCAVRPRRRHGTLIGTVAYMSPEQAQGKPVDPRSDVFSFGIVLYEMITGRRPFAGDNPMSILTSILRDTPAPVSRRSPSTPAALDRIVARCLEKNPDARYADASGAARRAPRAARHAVISNAGLAVAAPRSTRRWLAVAAVVVAIAAAAIGVWCVPARRSRQRWVRNEGAAAARSDRRPHPGARGGPRELGCVRPGAED